MMAEGEYRDAAVNAHVGDITDGWLLRCGCLYIMVKCADGVTRTHVIERSNRLEHLCVTYHAIAKTKD